MDGRGGFHVESKRKVNDGKWHHICLTHDEKYFELFVDGKSVGSRKGEKVNSDDTLKYNQLGSGLCDRWVYTVCNFFDSIISKLGYGL